jgi:hypothetical protein
MLNNKNNWLCFLLFLSVQASAQKEFTSQTTGRGDYSLVVYASGGLGYYPSYAGKLSYLQPKISNINPVSTVRLMWHPDHLLKVGLETGYMTFLSYTIKDSAGNRGKVVLNAIPLLLEWTMAVTKRINVFAGSGVYFTHTRLNYAGKISSRKLSVGWMAATSYIHPLSQNLGLGTEIKWMDAAESRDGSICVQLQLVWRFLKW